MTDLASQILSSFSTMSIQEAAFWLIVQNFLQFAICIAVGHLFVMQFQMHPIGERPLPLERREVLLALLCVFLNSIVAVIGWMLWKNGVIVIHNDVSWSLILDVAALLLLMDFLMYVTHRICHHKLFFSWVHGTHHL
jgi:lathosterol oxidase